MKRWRGTEGEMGKIMMDLGMDEEGDGECGERRSSSFDDNFQVGCVEMRWYHS